jgi:hypothetical protein
MGCLRAVVTGGHSPAETLLLKALDYKQNQEIVLDMAAFDYERDWTRKYTAIPSGCFKD